LNPDRWKRLEELFEAASNLSGTQRLLFLNENCSDDPTLRRQVETLISSSEEIESGSSTLLGEAVRNAAAAAVSAVDGQRIGPYQIIRQLGSGGMGAVYLAERADDQYRNQVAIKLVRDLLPGEELLERFRAERQILADLNHPNIARLLDGGVTTTGLPYLVMEYVEGVPIDDYCNNKKLSIAGRLELFKTVCLAVQHSHNHLIVHRDIKPNNILVTADGVPKLLDFGIAKPLRPLSSSRDNLTRTLQRLMTPEYASPEQIRGERITTATDVYSLGVLLYELLSGRPPFQLSGSSPAEVERIVCESEPDRPSSRTLVNGATTRPRVPRELDDVVLMAMHKDPERRYGSAAEFAEDIQRFLSNSPVKAHPESARYRVSRFVRRHRIGTATVALFLLMAAAFVTGVIVLARRAQNEAKVAQHTTDFLISLFQSNDPAQGRGDLITAREVLNRGTQRLQTELKDEPAVQVRLLDAIGTIFITLGNYKDARSVLDRSLDIRRRLFADDIGGMAETLAGLGYLTVELSQFQDSERYYRESLALCLRKYGKVDDNVAAVLSNLSSVLWEQGRYAEAVDLNQQAVDIRTQVLGREHRDTLTVMHNLASVYLANGNLAAAEKLAREVLAARQRTLTPKHPDLGFSLSILANILDRQGKFTEAEKASREALAVRTTAYQEANPQIAVTQYNLAAILCHTGKADEALSLAQQALDLDMKTFGPNHRDTAWARIAMAYVLYAKGRIREARDMQKAALESRKSIMDHKHPPIAEALVRLARYELALQNVSAAEAAITQAIEIQKTAPASQNLLAEVRLAQGRLEDASNLASSTNAAGIDLALAQSTLGWIAHLQHKDTEAKPLLETAMQSLQNSYGPTHPETLAVKSRLAAHLEAIAAPALRVTEGRSQSERSRDRKGVGGHIDSSRKRW
jgi:serine/threonine protein kinase/Tfp pilus assembly protein PilF